MRIFGAAAASGTGMGARSICARFRTADFDMSGSLGMPLLYTVGGRKARLFAPTHRRTDYHPEGLRCELFAAFWEGTMLLDESGNGSE